MGAPECDRVALYAATLPDARPLVRALTLAQLGGVTDAETLPLGARDRALMALWRGWFGEKVPCLDACEACKQEVSFDLPLAAFDEQSEQAPLATKGWRPLTTQDLVEVEHLPPDQARLSLTKAVTGDGAEDRAEVEAWLEAHDPLARLEIDLTCAFCAAQWSRPFDIVAHLWTALRGHGQALLREIHLLANAYHWSEADILTLPPARRRAYLQMVAQ